MIQVIWYLARGKQKMGPLTFHQLQLMNAQGQLAPQDMVLENGTQFWVPAVSVPGLFPVAQPVSEGIVPPLTSPSSSTPWGSVAASSQAVANPRPLQEKRNYTLSILHGVGISIAVLCLVIGVNLSLKSLVIFGWLVIFTVVGSIVATKEIFGIDYWRELNKKRSAGFIFTLCGFLAIASRLIKQANKDQTQKVLVPLGTPRAIGPQIGQTFSLRKNSICPKYQMEMDMSFTVGKVFKPRQQNLWVSSGSGSFPSR